MIICTSTIVLSNTDASIGLVSVLCVMAKCRWYFKPLKTRTANLRSEADYSADVEFGATRVDGSEMPSRPFMRTSVSETNFEQEFLEGYQQYQDISAAFDKTANALHTTIKMLIQDERWEWDRVTYRKNGQTVESPRDIVDTGKLLHGQKLEIY